MSELGEKLKTARREKGLSLDDLQQITKIQKRYLDAIEKGNYSVMPGRVYTRAFIKQYATAVGVDSRALFGEFEEEVSQSEQEAEEKQNRSQKKSTSLATTHSVRESADSTRSRFLDILPKILIVFFIVFILFIIWYFTFAKENSSNNAAENTNDNPTLKVQDETNSSSKNDKTPAKDKNASHAKEEEKKKEEEEKRKEEEKKKEEENKKVSVTKGETTGKKTTYTVKNADKLSLEISASGGSSWVNVTNASGANVYTKTLTDGANSGEINLDDNKSATIVVGNSPATVVKINGEQLELTPNMVKQILTIKLEDSSQEENDSPQ